MYSHFQCVYSSHSLIFFRKFYLFDKMMVWIYLAFLLRYNLVIQKLNFHLSGIINRICYSKLFSFLVDLRRIHLNHVFILKLLILLPLFVSDLQVKTIEEIFSILVVITVYIRYRQMWVNLLFQSEIILFLL